MDGTSRRRYAAPAMTFAADRTADVRVAIPASGKPLVLRLLLTTTRGEILREEFVVEGEQLVTKR